jgi:uncharacterized membrane protein
MVEMARIEGEHRRTMESKTLDANVEAMRKQFSEARVGQVFALIIALTFVLVGAFVIVRGYSWPGTTLGSVGLGGIVTSFIVGRGKGNNTTQNKQNRKGGGSQPSQSSTHSGTSINDQT